MPESFDISPAPPPVGSTTFSLHLWDQVRSFSINPEFGQVGIGTEEGRIEFLTGARLMGFELEEYDPARRLRELTDPEVARQHKKLRRDAGYFEQLVPQQLQISDTLDGHLSKYVFEISRRATKTTSIFLKLLGRCATRPGYQVTFSAQNGVAGSRRLREWAMRLDAMNPPDDLDLPPWMRGQARQRSKATQRQLALFGDELAPSQQLEEPRRGFRIMRGEVGKGIYFDRMGSQFLVLKPDADAYRGEGADDSWVDEFQEVDPIEGEELLAGILPLQDTKLGSSTIASGTAGEVRVGPFWKWIEQLRNGSEAMGGLDFAFPEDTPWELLENEDQAIELLKAHHPGMGTLTTEAKMRESYRGMALPKWAREYGSVWPETFGSVVIDAGQWAAGKLEKKPARPARVAFGQDIKPGGGVAALVAAWRSSTGIAYIEVVAHQSGTTWIPKRSQELTRTYRGSTIAYDDIAEGKATATEMERLTPKPRMRMQTYRETAAGSVQLLRDLERGNLRHFGQIGLDTAVDIAAKRETRGDTGVWLFTPAEHGGDITCLVAAVRALRNWDQHFARGGGGLKPTSEGFA